MPKPQPSPNRHHFRVWVKWVIESGTLEKLPRTYNPDESQPPRMTEHYARELLADLRDPDARKRPLKEIIADARQFRAWVESRRKDNLRLLLIDSRPEQRIVEIPPRRHRSAPHNERPPLRTARTEQPDANPRLNPMWDDWVDRSV